LVKARAAPADYDDFAKVCRIRHVFPRLQLRLAQVRIETWHCKLFAFSGDLAKRTLVRFMA
jgi:hypothetical protein